MSFHLFLGTAPIVQFHVAAASLAILLGPVAILRRRRDRLHKVTGYIWVIAMAATAMSSFWITSFAMIGPFSPIHLLAVLALWSLWEGMTAAFRGDTAAHRAAMEGLYWRGLLVAGLFNFLPGRLMNRMILGDNASTGYVVIVLGLAVLFAAPIRRWLRRARVPAILSLR